MRTSDLAAAFRRQRCAEQVTSGLVVGVLAVSWVRSCCRQTRQDLGQKSVEMGQIHGK